jgi:single-stranded-DNA-specific exonuclease
MVTTPLSLTGKQWIWPQEPSSFTSIMPLAPWVLDLLSRRGIVGDEALARYLEPSLTFLDDPALMQDMSIAIERLRQAIITQEAIVVYGDYDVDGVCSASILVDFLTAVGARVDYYIPDRRHEGYGLNEKAVRHIAAQATLLVTTDCGITAAYEIGVARSLGCDVIVVDHHQVPETLPPAVANLNPHRTDCAYPFKDLCAAGVAFILVAGLRRTLRDAGHFDGGTEPDIRNLLDLVAVATVADMVPMRGTNRVLVKAGLKRLQIIQRPGLQALLQVAEINASLVSAFDLGFKIGPRINARGRLGHAKEAVELLLTKDPTRAQQLALELNAANLERQVLEKATLQAAINKVDVQEKAIVVFDPTWHPGVLGLVASRLVEKFCRPAIVIGEGGKGSGRSIAGLNLHAAISACAQHLLRFGGHHAACGVTIAPESVASFAAVFAAEVVQTLGAGPYTPKVKPDLELSVQQLNLETVAQVEQLGPFGQGNSEPLFVASNLRVQNKRMVGTSHVKLTIDTSSGVVDAIGFRLGHLLEAIPENIDIAFHLERNVFRGKESVQMRIVDIRGIS